MEPISILKKLRRLRWTIIALSCIPVILWLFIQGQRNAGTGLDFFPFNESLGTKTVWDWMELLLIPLTLAGAALLWKHSDQRLDTQRFGEHSSLEKEIAADNQREAALQAYFDRMAELILKEKLSKFSTDEIRTVARARTLTILREVDSKRKGLVFLFLKDSGLIDREAVIDLSGADLRGMSIPFARVNRVNLGEADLSAANLQGAGLSKSYLGGTDLRNANLADADLTGSDLFEANLSGANLSRASLAGTKLSGADLRGCCLNGANLSNADMSGANLNVGDMAGANLRGAKLGGARLLGANLTAADLTQADLTGTEITRDELEKAKSLVGAILPDGTKHE